MNDHSVEQNALLLLWSMLRNNLMPELTSALAKDRAKRGDAVLLRLIAGYQHLPAMRSAFRGQYADLLASAREMTAARETTAARASGTTAPRSDLSSLDDSPTFVGVPALAGSLEQTLIGLMPANAAESKPDERIDAFVRQVAETEAAMRTAYETAVTGVKPVVARALRPVSPESLQSYLRAHPQGSSSVRVTSVADIPGGRSKRTILASLESPGSLPPSIVLRMDTDRGVGTRVGSEYPLLARVAAHGLPVPQPLWLESDRAAFGFPFIVFRRMPGQAAGDLIEGAFKKVPATGRALAKALAAVHGRGVQLVEDPSMRGPAVARTHEMLDGYYNYWCEKKPFPSLIIEAAFVWMRRHAGRACGQTTVVQADTGFHNLLLDEAGTPCLLDWEFAHYGDGAEDLAACRPAVQQLMPWEDFLAEYYAQGGQRVTESQLGYFEIWRPLRNAVVCGTVAHSLMRGEADDIDPVTIALSTFQRLQADLARSLAVAAGR